MYVKVTLLLLKVPRVQYLETAEADMARPGQPSHDRSFSGRIAAVYG
jgi:hypothetical protein